jgi:hypothetical protein
VAEGVHVAPADRLNRSQHKFAGIFHTVPSG